MSRVQSRFNLLLLEEGEYLLEEYSASMYIHEASVGALQDYNLKSKYKGRLRICTRGVSFEPEDVHAPIHYFHFKYQPCRPDPLESLRKRSFYNRFSSPLLGDGVNVADSFLFQPLHVVLAKASNQIAPFDSQVYADPTRPDADDGNSTPSKLTPKEKQRRDRQRLKVDLDGKFTDGRCTVVFSLLHSSCAPVISLCQTFWEIQKSTNSHGSINLSQERKLVNAQLLSRREGPFNVSLIGDYREQPLLPASPNAIVVERIYPLLSCPQRLMITEKCLYLMPVTVNYVAGSDSVAKILFKDVRRVQKRSRLFCKNSLEISLIAGSPSAGSGVNAQSLGLRSSSVLNLKVFLVFSDQIVRDRIYSMILDIIEKNSGTPSLSTSLGRPGSNNSLLGNSGGFPGNDFPSLPALGQQFPSPFAGFNSPISTQSTFSSNLFGSFNSPFQSDSPSSTSVGGGFGSSGDRDISGSGYTLHLFNAKGDYTEAHIKQATKMWQKKKLSNLQYLLFINDAAGRTFADITQYPVFPWVLKDFSSSTLDLDNPEVFRDLSKPIGALNPERLALFKSRFDNMIDDILHDPSSSLARKYPTANDLLDHVHEIKTTDLFLYGTHYSTPGYCLYYLVRSLPEHMLRLQAGKFDEPDRMFYDISTTYRGIVSMNSDLKEMIPEFFFSSSSSPISTYSTTLDFLRCPDDLSLGVRQDGTFLGDVVLPPWSNGSVENFLDAHVRALESPTVSGGLHAWIDLIFGQKQRGKAAVDANNLFHPSTYEGVIDFTSLYATNAEEAFAKEVQVAEFGQCPSQIFTAAHPPRQAAPASSAAEEKSEDVSSPSADSAFHSRNDSNLDITSLSSSVRALEAASLPHTPQLLGASSNSVRSSPFLVSEKSLSSVHSGEVAGFPSPLGPGTPSSSDRSVSLGVLEPQTEALSPAHSLPRWIQESSKQGGFLPLHVRFTHNSSRRIELGSTRTSSSAGSRKYDADGVSEGSEEEFQLSSLRSTISSLRLSKLFVSKAIDGSPLWLPDLRLSATLYGGSVCSLSVRHPVLNVRSQSQLGEKDSFAQDADAEDNPLSRSDDAQIRKSAPLDVDASSPAPVLAFSAVYGTEQVPAIAQSNTLLLHSSRAAVSSESLGVSFAAMLDGSVAVLSQPHMQLLARLDKNVILQAVGLTAQSPAPVRTLLAVPAGTAVDATSGLSGDELFLVIGTSNGCLLSLPVFVPHTLMESESSHEKNAVKLREERATSIKLGEAGITTICNAGSALSQAAIEPLPLAVGDLAGTVHLLSLASSLLNLRVSKAYISMSRPVHSKQRAPDFVREAESLPQLTHTSSTTCTRVHPLTRLENSRAHFVGAMGASNGSGGTSGIVGLYFGCSGSLQQLNQLLEGEFEGNFLQGFLEMGLQGPEELIPPSMRGVRLNYCLLAVCSDGRVAVLGCSGVPDALEHETTGTSIFPLLELSCGSALRAAAFVNGILALLEDGDGVHTALSVDGISTVSEQGSVQTEQKKKEDIDGWGTYSVLNANLTPSLGPDGSTSLESVNITLRQMASGARAGVRVIDIPLLLLSAARDPLNYTLFRRAGVREDVSPSNPADTDLFVLSLSANGDGAMRICRTKPTSSDSAVKLGRRVISAKRNEHKPTHSLLDELEKSEMRNSKNAFDSLNSSASSNPFASVSNDSLTKDVDLTHPNEEDKEEAAGNPFLEPTDALKLSREDSTSASVFMSVNNVTGDDSVSVSTMSDYADNGNVNDEGEVDNDEEREVEEFDESSIHDYSMEIKEKTIFHTISGVSMVPLPGIGPSSCLSLAYLPSVSGNVVSESKDDALLCVVSRGPDIYTLLISSVPV